MKKEFKSMVRTDLAVEAKDMYVKELNDNSQLIEEDTEDVNGIKVNRVEIDEQLAEQIGKKKGTYITLYTDSVKDGDTKMQEQAEEVLAKELKRLLQKNNISKEAKGLIVGLGNWHVTPDALGPMAVEKVIVTNHMFLLDDASVTEGYRPVAAVTPGVMGLTGLETSDIIKGIVEKGTPDFVIAIDALAARAVERLNETIQLSDAGISPGSGVGNKRKELSIDTLGVPVFAIGVPTVVDATTITNDALDDLLKHFGRAWNEKDKPSQSLLPGGFHFGKKVLTDEDLPNEQECEAVLGMVGKLTDEEKRALLQEVLSPLGHNLIVTPKEIDQLMNDMSYVIANGVNTALHENIRPEDASSYNR